MKSKLKENPKPLRFIRIQPSLEPTQDQIKLFYILNTLDLIMTMHALKHPDIKEGNPLLGPSPSNKRLILHKLVLAPLIEQNFNTHQLFVVNTALGVTVINNALVMSRYGAW